MLVAVAALGLVVPAAGAPEDRPPAPAGPPLLDEESSSAVERRGPPAPPVEPDTPVPPRPSSTDEPLSDEITARPGQDRGRSPAPAAPTAAAPSPTSSAADARRERARPSLAFVPGEVIVRFAAGASEAARSSLLSRRGLRVKRRLLLPDAAVVHVGRRSVRTEAAALSQAPEVLYAEPNYLRQPALIPNDTQFGDLWGFNNMADKDIDAPEAWDITTGSAAITAAVLDTGITVTHTDLAPNMWSNPGETLSDGIDNDGNGLIDDVNGWDFAGEFELQWLVEIGAPTGGTFTLTYDGQTTGLIPHNATASTVQTALENLPNLDPGDIFVFRGPLPDRMFVEFAAQTDAPQITVGTSSLTGGSSPEVLVATFSDGRAVGGPPRDYDGHGTHVAGTIGAKGNNAFGVPGVNHDVDLIGVRVCAFIGCPDDAIANGIAYAGALVAGVPRARVANGSFGGEGFSQTILDALNASGSTLYMFAAGNDGTDNDLTPMYPCSYPDGVTSTTNTAGNIVCVAATGMTDALTGFSNFGDTSVDLGAPGLSIKSTFPDWDPVYSDDMETASTWTTGGTSNTWALTTEKAVSPTKSLTDSPGANYVANTNSFARRTSTVNLSGKQGCQLNYQIDFDLAPGPGLSDDLLLMETTTNGTTFVQVPFGEWGPGTAGGFFESTDPLALDGEPSANFRWRLYSNGVTNADGAWVDDVVLECLATTTYGESDVAVLSGTSMSTPMATGAAALVAARAAALSIGLSVAQLKTILLESVDPVAALAGLTVTGGRLNLFKAVSGFCSGSPATLIGTDGNNVVAGTAGNDVVVTFAGNDQITGSAGDDRICAGGGNDLVHGNADADILQGGSGDDALNGGTEDDNLDGGDGNDTLRGMLGNDTLAGGPGLGDWVTFLEAPGAVNANLLTGSATGQGIDLLSGIEALQGGAFNDTLIGNGLNNALRGEGGTDTLMGHGGDDHLLGGAGDDNATLDGGPGNDVLWGGDGVDKLLGGPGNDQLLGEGGDDGGTTGLLDGGDGNDYLWGGFGHDKLLGGADFDFLSGEAGVDELDGGAGHDHLNGGPDNDSLTGSTGNDWVNYEFASGPVTVDLSAAPGTASGAGVGTDTLFGIELVVGSAFNDIITGNSVGNILRGGNGNDSLTGNDGEDILEGGPGDDISTLDGGPGNDVLFGGDGTDKLLGGTGNDQLFGGPGDDGGTNGLLDGGDGNDQIFGGPGADNLVGGADDDALNGGSQNDQLNGGTGHDTLRGAADDDGLIGGAGNDWVAYSEAPAGVNANLTTGLATGEGSDTLSGIEHLLGSPFNDTFTGDGEPNTLVGQGGADTLTGNAGDDVLDGGIGDDPLLDGGAGADDLFGGPGTDKLVGGTEDDELRGGPGDDKPVPAGPTGGLEGGPGDDRLQGGPGSDKLDGGDGNDGLAGGDGNDELIGGLGNDIAAFFDSISGVIASLADGTATGQGSDTLTGIENLFGSPHNDSLTGNDAANSIFGDAGDDSLFGLAGPDFLDGGLNTDTIDGGTDADFDTCVNGETVTNCP